MGGMWGGQKLKGGESGRRWKKGGRAGESSGRERRWRVILLHLFLLLLLLLTLLYFPFPPSFLQVFRSSLLSLPPSIHLSLSFFIQRTSRGLTCPIDYKRTHSSAFQTHTHTLGPLLRVLTWWLSAYAPSSVAGPFYCQQKMFNEFHPLFFHSVR